MAANNEQAVCSEQSNKTSRKSWERLVYVCGYKMFTRPWSSGPKVGQFDSIRTARARRYVQPVGEDQTQLESFRRLADVALRHR